MRNPIKLAAGLLAVAMLLTFAAFAEEAPVAENYERYAGAWYAADDPWDGRFYVTIESVGDGWMTWSLSDVFCNATVYQAFEGTELTDGAAPFHMEGEALYDENQVFSYDGAIALKDGAVALTFTAGELEERSPEGGSTSHHVEAIDEAERTFVLSRRGELPTEAIERFSDTWVDDGAAVEIWYDGGTFHCRGVLGDGGDESNVFEYTFAEYDAAGDALVCENGTRTYEKRDAKGDLESDLVVNDLAATFTVDDQDRLIWNDSEGICKRFALQRLDVAEEAEGDGVGLVIDCGIEDGGYVIRFPVEDEGWVADDMAQDDSVVKLERAEIVDGSFVARYAPVADGDVTVSVRHFDGIACDRVMTWDLRVADGAVRECIGGSHAEAPDEAVQDPLLSGEWLEAETQFSQMSIAKNPEKGWNVEVISPVSHGAYVFQATMFYDCELDKFVYDGGRFYDVPITDSDDPELGDPIVTGTAGTFELVGEENDVRLSWYNSRSPEENVVFERVQSASAGETFESEGRTVEPMPETVDLEDGTYPAAFDRARLADGALTLNIFTEDCYDIVDISTLAVGDTIVIEGAPVKVEMLERQDDLLINGGIDAGGFDLRPYDGDNCWKVAQYDDYPTYTDHGEATLPLADDVAFTDGWDIEKDPVTVTGAEAVARAIAESGNDTFVVYNTTVEIAGGKIARIERSYMP